MRMEEGRRGWKQAFLQVRRNCRQKGVGEQEKTLNAFKLTYTTAK
jgi:hypothetical protein